MKIVLLIALRHDNFYPIIMLTGRNADKDNGEERARRSGQSQELQPAVANSVGKPDVIFVNLVPDKDKEEEKM